MKPSVVALLLIAASLLVVAQGPEPALLSPGTTLPIAFSKTIEANRAHAGDRVEARTTDPVLLAKGGTLPSGSLVVGHVVSSTGFTYDTTPYAKQSHSVLVIHFDSVQMGGKDPITIPLQVYVRAMADPLTVQAALTPNLYDDSLRSRAQVGGDIVTPSQSEVISQSDDVVGYLKHGHVYAHLLSASGNRSEGCSAGEREVSMGVFSANACGLYGFTGVTLDTTGRTGEPSTFSLGSTRRAPEIWARSAALLEVEGSSPTAAVVNVHKTKPDLPSTQDLSQR
jgi:hypothetical protein